jgi:histidine ammonia-lyase
MNQEVLPSPSVLVLDGNHLTLEQLYQSRQAHIEIQLAPSARERLARHWELVVQTVETSSQKCTLLKEKLKHASTQEKSLQNTLELELTKQSIYGVNTGFGQLKTQALQDLQEMKKLQENILRSHAAGVGEPLPQEWVRMMMVLRINTLARAQSGIRLETLDRFLCLLNHRIWPLVPSQGSVGASGDLAPLAHMSLMLIGEGEIYQGSSPIPQEQAEGLYRSLGLPLKYSLDYKEGLSLTNGTTTMTAIGSAVWMEAWQTFKAAILACSLSMEALFARTRALDEVVHKQRPHFGQQKVAQRLRFLLKDSEYLNQWPHVHDAYSLRCSPQVLGAVLDQLKHIRTILEIELNATVDDPLFFLAEDLEGSEKPLDGWEDRIHYEQGHFHGEPIAFVMDLLKIAMAELANISERRIQHLLDHHHNRGLTSCLLTPEAIEEGSHSGLLIAQYTAASLVSENKVLAHPASVDSIPTSANHEDHVSMGTIASRQAHQVVQNVRKVIAIELICATQALYLRKTQHPTWRLGSQTQQVLESLQKIFPLWTQDRYLAQDLRNMENAILHNKIALLSDFPALYEK